MSNYPLTHALIVELCGLDEVDAQLPLTVIANLHRSVLRLPLLGMVPLREAYNNITERNVLAGHRAQTFKEMLAERADLDWEAILKSTALDKALSPVTAACRDRTNTATGLVRELLAEPLKGWQAYEPLALLYHIGDGLPCEDAVPAIELGLELVPQLHPFALACAQVVPYAPVRLV